jgi:hypothetical protein
MNFFKRLIFVNFYIISGFLAVSKTANAEGLRQNEPPIKIGFASVDIQSCTGMMDGRLQAVEYTVQIPDSITTCVGAADVTLFLLNPNTPVIANANAINSVILDSNMYTTTTYIAPYSPCGLGGSLCWVGIGFSCYDPGSSTVYVGGTGKTCKQTLTK